MWVVNWLLISRDCRVNENFIDANPVIAQIIA